MIQAIKCVNLQKFTLLIFVLVSILFVGHGKLDGDERMLLDLSSYVIDNNFSIVKLSGFKAYSWLAAHHPLWFFMDFLIVTAVFVAAKLIPVLQNRIIIEFILSYGQVLTIATAIWLTYKYLIISKHSHIHALYCTLFFWFGSYACSFLSGGLIENTMCLLVIARLFLLEQFKNDSANDRTLILMALVDVLLVASKPYALVYCIPSFLFLGLGWKKTGYYFIFLIPLLGLLLSFKLYLGTPNYLSALGLSVNSIASLLTTILFFSKMLFIQLFSFSYGTMWSLPFLWFIFARLNRDLIVALIPLVFLFLLFGLLKDTWHGASGIAGPRYIFPFVITLLPIAVKNAQLLIERYKSLLLAMPLFLILFLPTLNYSHNIVVHFTEFKRVSDDNENRWFPSTGRHQLDEVPYFDILFHPAIFAWKVQMSKLFNNEIVFTTGREVRSVKPNDVHPRILISRFIYLGDHPDKISDSYQQHKILASSIPNYLFITAWFTQLIWLTLFAWCAIWVSIVYFRQTGNRHAT